MLRLKVSPSHLANRVLLLLLAGSLLAACGPLGDDDEGEPTSTPESIQQPTMGPDGEAPVTSAAAMPTVTDGTPVVTNTDLSSPVGDSDDESRTPETISVSTPLPDGDSSPASPGATPFAVGATGTPVASDGGDEEIQSGEAVNDDAQFSDSDGTSGAVPGAPQDSDMLSDATPTSDTSPEATPDDQPFFVEDDATPVAGASPAAVADAALADLQPITVESCEVSTVPAVTIDQVNYVTNTDVNFRVGPGADCDAIGSGPIGGFSAVTLLSDPVVRDGDDDFVWVQVEIAGETGWIITEVLDPAT